MDQLPIEAALPTPNSEQESHALTDLYVRSQSVVSRRIAGETLIVPVRGKVGDLASIYSFNATGTLLWESLASPQSFADLVEVIHREYAVEVEQADRDVRQFLSDAISAGLIEMSKTEVSSDGFVSGHDFSRAESAQLETRL
jgi:hypothetical protein